MHCNLDLEQVLIGVLLKSGSKIELIDRVLGSESMHDRTHSLIWKSMLSIHARCGTIDLHTVAEALSQSGKLKAIGGKDKLQKLQDLAPHGVDLEDYAKQIQGLYLRRLLTVDLLDAIAKLGNDTSKPIEEVLQSVERLVYGVTQQQSASKFLSFADVSTGIFAKIEERAESKLPLGLPTGFYDLDNWTNGFQPEKSIYLVGESGTGKTSWACQVAEYMAYTESRPVLYFSLEMSTEALFIRRVAAAAKVDSSRIKSGRINSHEWEPIGHGISKLSANSNFVVEDSSGLTIEDIASKARKYKSDNGDLGAIFIDHLGLINHAPLPVFEGNSHIARSVMALAKELQVPIVVLCQLNSDFKGRKDKRPIETDIAYGSVAKQCADIIIGLYRHEKYEPENPYYKGVAEMILLKHRDGRTGTIELIFDAQYTAFQNKSSAVPTFDYAVKPPPILKSARVDEVERDRLLSENLVGEWE